MILFEIMFKIIFKYINRTTKTEYEVFTYLKW